MQSPHNDIPAARAPSSPQQPLAHGRIRSCSWLLLNPGSGGSPWFGMTACDLGLTEVSVVATIAPAMPTRTSKSTQESKPRSRELPKSPTGIQGLDEITGGGFPHG